MTGGFAHRFVLFLGAPQEAEAFVKEMKRDFEIFKKVSSCPAPSALLRL